MSKASTSEVKTADTKVTQAGSEARPVAREGKTYAYQRPQETASVPPAVVDLKDKVVTALDDLIAALAAQFAASAAPAAAGTGTGGSPPAAAGGATGSAGAASGTGSAGGAAYGGGAGGASTGAGTTPKPPAGGEQPAVSEAAKAAVEREAQEVSIATQRSAFAMDRARETSKARARESAAAPAVAASGGGVQILGASSKHTSDSNRAPLTEAHQWTSSYGSLGKAAAPTIEAMAVPVKRPETVPAAGTVSSPKPIDAYWGSFGTAIERASVRAKVAYTQLESIIGTDDRVRVTNNQIYPWRCICSLLITANTGAQYLGTGWLVSPRLVLTAGHCVYMADEGGWVTQIEVIPGRNGDQRPFNSAIARDFRSVSGWTQDNDSDYDYGGILLPADKRYGEQLGWFGYASRGDDYLRGLTLNLAGYPGDGGKAPNNVDGTQWYNSRGVKEVLEKQLTYEIDTYGGQSGAPVWEMASDGSRYGVAIHTFGTPVNNGGTRITGDVFDNIVLWAGQAP
jgi:glutamyl endopeptidase